MKSRPVTQAQVDEWLQQQTPRKNDSYRLGFLLSQIAHALTTPQTLAAWRKQLRRYHRFHQGELDV